MFAALFLQTNLTFILLVRLIIKVFQNSPATSKGVHSKRTSMQMQ
jgi:hypothetical protein